MNEPETVFRETLPALLSRMPDVASESGFALPDGTLSLLGDLVRDASIRHVFEFGSGRSTKTFLDAGCHVTSLEDSHQWLEQTMANIPAASSERLHAVAQPLDIVWHGGAPLRSWRLGEKMCEALHDAELILIDSPSFPPFREHALILSLQHATKAVIVIDDANIATIQRFCRRIAALNPNLNTFSTTKDHGLFFFGKAGSHTPRFRRGLIETCKMWRRFFSAGRSVKN